MGYQSGDPDPLDHELSVRSGGDSHVRPGEFERTRSRTRHVIDSVDNFLLRYAFLIAGVMTLGWLTTMFVNYLLLYNQVENEKVDALKKIVGSLGKVQLNLTDCEQPTYLESMSECFDGICKEVSDRLSFDSVSLNTACDGVTTTAKIIAPNDNYNDHGYASQVNVASSLFVSFVIYFIEGGVWSFHTSFNSPRLKALKYGLHLTAIGMGAALAFLPWLIDRYWNDMADVGKALACQAACQFVRTMDMSGGAIYSTNGEVPDVGEKHTRNFSLAGQLACSSVIAGSALCASALFGRKIFTMLERRWGTDEERQSILSS